MPAHHYHAVPKTQKEHFSFKNNKKYLTIALYAFAVIAASVLLVFLFLNYGNFGVYFSKIVSVMNPIFLGVLFAYLLNPLLRFFENKVFASFGKKSGKIKGRRIIAVVATYLTLIIIITGFIWILVPQIVSGYKDLYSNMSNYINTLKKWLASLASQSKLFSEPLTKLMDYINSLLDDIYGLIEKIIPGVTSAVSGVIVAVKNSLLGIILSVYFLLVKEQLGAQSKKLLCSVMTPVHYTKLLDAAVDADSRFGKYITGKILDSFIIGMLTFACTAVFSIPYYPLVSLIVGVTNIIPVFGPIIGGIIGAFIVFIANPIDALWFGLIVFLIQQLDGNYIGPKILGSATGLDPVWVMIAITVMSGFFGFMGMLLGVPLFAVIYYLIKRRVESRLTERGYNTDTKNYIGSDVGMQLYLERKTEKPKNKDSKISVFIREKSKKAIRTIASKSKKKKKAKSVLLPEEKKEEESTLI